MRNGVQDEPRRMSVDNRERINASYIGRDGKVYVCMGLVTRTRDARARRERFVSMRASCEGKKTRAHTQTHDAEQWEK